MKIGIALTMAGDPAQADHAVVRDHMELGSLALSRCFDSLFVYEHHFSPYMLSPEPMCLLSYFAGRTSALLGAAVLVLPWRSPVRTAEQIALVDILSRGRCLIGIGRGRSTREYEGFSVSQTDSKARFEEYTDVIMRLLSGDSVTYEGAFVRIRNVSILPQSPHNPRTRMYTPVSSSESASFAAKYRLGMLATTRKPWDCIAADWQNYIGRYPDRALARPPIVFAAISVSKSRCVAEELAGEFLGRDEVASGKHYDNDTALHSGETEDRLHPVHAHQIVGTPEDCIQRIRELMRTTSSDHVVMEFSYGGMPLKLAKSAIELFAREVLPRVRTSTSVAESLEHP